MTLFYSIFSEKRFLKKELDSLKEFDDFFIDDSDDFTKNDLDDCLINDNHLLKCHLLKDYSLKDHSLKTNSLKDYSPKDHVLKTGSNKNEYYIKSIYMARRRSTSDIGYSENFDEKNLYLIKSDKLKSLWEIDLD